MHCRKTAATLPHTHSIRPPSNNNIYAVYRTGRQPRQGSPLTKPSVSMVNVPHTTARQSHPRQQAVSQWSSPPPGVPQCPRVTWVATPARLVCYVSAKRHQGAPSADALCVCTEGHLGMPETASGIASTGAAWSWALSAHNMCWCAAGCRSFLQRPDTGFRPGPPQVAF